MISLLRDRISAQYGRDDVLKARTLPFSSDSMFYSMKADLENEKDLFVAIVFVDRIKPRRGTEEANTCLLILFPRAKFPASRLGPLPFSLDKGGCILKTAGCIIYILWDHSVIGGREVLFVAQLLPSEL